MPRLTNTDINTDIETMLREFRENLSEEDYITNMFREGLTFNISGNRVRLKPVFETSNAHAWPEIRIEGLTDDSLTLVYSGKEDLYQDMQAFGYLFEKLSKLQPETWGNSRGVMSRGEIQLMRLAIRCGGIAILACLVYLLVILFK